MKEFIDGFVYYMSPLFGFFLMFMLFRLRFLRIRKMALSKTERYMLISSFVVVVSMILWVAV